jgi:hypothetical protein
MVAQNISGNSIQIDTSNLVAGVQGLFRVWASDGIHTASDSSDGSFTIPNHLPTARILRPGTAVTLVVSSTLGLQAEVYDPDLGTLTDNQVQWLSSIDGVLGQGASLSIADLHVGVHVITLHVDDGAGGVITDSVPVTIVGDLSQLPPPLHKLRAGPEQISFNPAEGLVSATIVIDQQDSPVSLRWNAFTAQPWVQLSATAGDTTPALLTATFNPTGLAQGIYTTTVTVTSPDAPDERIILPVNATISDNRIFLPVVAR